MIKVLNIAIGVVIVALVAVVGLLAYFYLRPSSQATTKLEWDLKQWKERVNEKPDDPLGRANLGAVYLEMGDTEAAIKELKTAVNLAPEGYTYIYSLGRAYQEAGDMDSAMEMMIKALELYPRGEKFTIAYDLARIHWERGDLATAKDYLQQSIADNQMTWNSHYLLGQIFEREGDKTRAREEYEAAARFNPTDQELQEALKRVSG